MDGSVKQEDGLCYGGGLVRDAGGGWRGVFRSGFGNSSVLGAEFWAVNEGLLLPWSKRLRRVPLERHNSIIVSILQRTKLRKNCKVNRS
ncbi:hypothetical protein GH714_040475 [Hevea brasiliensis]|uniref:RNase H type-1 domain-containing protein n=1 Tax=Hevea brasiliensis TaxID=3981 RepID=A0A6A6L569_HEVBR|nr:hypothetical protein GH714_040475 [Hevea brasiliensis]